MRPSQFHTCVSLCKYHIMDELMSITHDLYPQIHDRVVELVK